MTDEITSRDTQTSFQFGPEKTTIDFDTCYKKEISIIQKNGNEFSNSAKNTFQWGIAFAGMLCLCFPIPAVQITGVTLIGLASAIYLARNADRIGQGITDLKAKFFKTDPTTKDESIPLLPAEEPPEEGDASQKTL